MTSLPQTPMRLPQPMLPAPVAPPANLPAQAAPLVIASHPMSGADVWRVIRANLWLIFLMLVLSVGAGFGSYRFLLSQWPRYTATGLLKIEPVLAMDPLTDKREEVADTRMISELRTQAQLLQTDRLFAEVFKKSDGELRKTKWFAQFIDPNTGEPDVKAAKESLQQDFAVAPVADSFLLRVTFSYSQPRDCKTVVEEIVNKHLEQEQEKAQNRFNEQTKTLRGMRDSYTLRLDEVSKQAREAQGDLTKRGVGGVGMFAGTKETELKAKVEAQLKLQALASEASSKFERIRDQKKRGERLMEVETAIETDPTVNSLSREASALEIQRDLQRLTLGDEHRDVQRLTRSIEITSAKLEQKRTELRVRFEEQYLRSIEAIYQQTKVDYEAMSRSVDELKRDLAELGKEMSRLEAMKEEEKILRDQLQQVNNKIRDLEVSRRPSGTARIDWASMPEIPDVPSFPRLASTMTVSIVIGLLLSLGIAFLREFLDDTVRRPSDVTRLGQMNLLGVIADERDDPEAGGTALPIFDAPYSMTAEQFRQVRTRLGHTPGLDTARSLLVTGPGPLDGKTTVAANLAAGLALNGRKVLLVDSNFRRPEVHRVFGVANEKGLSDVLNGTLAFEDALAAARVPSLTVMSSGARPLNATELLESQLLVDFIERALEDFDFVIFDSGPFLVVSDAVALAPRVDGVIAVVRAHAESRGLLRRMGEGLKEVRAKHVGVVLNAVKAHGGGYFRRNIKAYYEYQ